MLVERDQLQYSNHHYYIIILSASVFIIITFALHSYHYCSCSTSPHLLIIIPSAFTCLGCHYVSIYCRIKLSGLLDYNAGVQLGCFVYITDKLIALYGVCFPTHQLGCFTCFIIIIHSLIIIEDGYTSYICTCPCTTFINIQSNSFCP